MNKKILWGLLLAVCFVLPAKAQRSMDLLNRGLVAVNQSNGVFLSWRRLGEEYYDVAYNIYRDGTKLNDTPLNVTNYVDASGSNQNTYTVKAVVQGIEQPACAGVQPWLGYDYNGNLSGYLDIELASVKDRSTPAVDVTENYLPNDAEMADLNGDGDLEVIIKRLNTVDANEGFPNTSKQFEIFDAYDINWQTGDAKLMWRIDCGPNMANQNSVETSLIAFDWDGDSAAEVVLRGTDDMIIYYNENGNTVSLTIGVAGANYRGSTTQFVHDGSEYLIYMNGSTGKPYQVLDYPLKRLEDGETNLKTAWGDDYGHRSTKHFFGAPYLDGHKPSIFLARGIYTRHKMIAYDVNPKNHTLTKRWTWANNSPGSVYYGQGNHNYIVADVDWDGRDEIIYGSMVIDDSGKGLSSTGLGHGDAIHCSDFNPYVHGQEIFACNEDNPYMNYRDGTTSKIYYRSVGSDDDGRALMGNFCNNYPGSQGTTAATDVISSVTNDVIFTPPPFDDKVVFAGGHLNFRIYWDGDLNSEAFDSPGTAREAMIMDYERGRLFTSLDCNLNNGSKNNPCFQGDVIGDWREEILVNHGHGLRLYTSAIPSLYSLPTLWHDHQYRQAMGWQMMAYNQPPHTSYFVGELEGITVAPPPLTNHGRKVIESGATINASYNGQHLLHNQYDNTTLNVSEGAEPYILTINVPTWVQGTNSTSTTNPVITTTTYTCDLGGGGLAGNMRLVKQGDGILNMASATHTYTGETTIWGGTVNFDGTMSQSPVTLKRLTTLNSDGGTFANSLSMEYGSTLNIGGATAGKLGTVTIGELNLGFGSRIVVDIKGKGDDEHDWINAAVLNVDDSKVGVEAWENYGPQYITPVVEVRFSGTIEQGFYPIGNVETVNGNISRVVVESAAGNNGLSLVVQNGMIGIQTDAVPEAVEPTIAIVGMNSKDLSSFYPGLPASKYGYLPVVSITGHNTNGQAPTISGTFTDIDGNVTNLGTAGSTTFYTEDYNAATGADDWVASCTRTLEEGDANYDKYVRLYSDNQGGNRRNYKYFYTGQNFYGDAQSYTVEFDAQFHRSNMSGNVNELVLLGEGATLPQYVYDYFASASNNYLFRMTGGNNNKTYAVENSNATAEIGDSWCHYTIEVNRETRQVTYTIKKGSTVVLSGTYEANENASMEVQGIGIVLGRSYSYAFVDNFSITSSVSLDTYAFEKPGTLTIQAAINGYNPASATYTVEKPYVVLYESPDYNTIAASEATAKLGDMWYFNEENSHVDVRDWVRFANWNKNLTYTFAINRVNSNTERIYVDKDRRLWVDYTNSAQNLHLVETFGVGMSGGATFHANNLGDENSILYLRYDFSLGNGPNIFEQCIQGNADGTFTYGKHEGALQKFAAYVPLHPIWGDVNHDGNVSVADVMALIYWVLDQEIETLPKVEADLNDDSNVSIADVMMLINYILLQ